MATYYYSPLWLEEHRETLLLKIQDNITIIGECWIWQRSCASGYGRLKFRHVVLQCHRLVYELHWGQIPFGLFVLHKCDEKLCLNPQHLFLGTQLDNIQDCIKKGRFRPGKMPGAL